jgi:hypothetical protein
MYGHGFIHVISWTCRSSIHPGCLRSIHRPYYDVSAVESELRSLAHYQDHRIHLVDPSRTAIAKQFVVLGQRESSSRTCADLQGIALILGSLIAFGLGHVTNGSLYRYQYIFLVNGSV